MRASLRSVFLVLMVFACVGAAGAAPRVFTLTSGKTVEGEVVFVSRDEVIVNGTVVNQVFYLPLNQFTLADQTALVQWGRAKMARWANVVIQFSSGNRTDRIRTDSTHYTKTYLVGKMAIQNRSPQPLPLVRAVMSVDFETNKNAETSSMPPSQDTRFARSFGSLAVGRSHEEEVFKLQVKEKVELAKAYSATKQNLSKKEEAEREIAMLRVSVYVGPELIWHQRVK